MSVFYISNNVEKVNFAKNRFKKIFAEDFIVENERDKYILKTIEDSTPIEIKDKFYNEVEFYKIIILVLFQNIFKVQKLYCK
jgi:hypothetical protein